MKRSSIGLGILSAALIASAASAGETFGDGAQALPLQQSGGTARAMGMGSAVVAVEQGSASLLWNPAGLGRMGSKEIGLHHNSGLGGIMQEILVVGTPLGAIHEEGKGGSFGGVAASLGYVNYGNFAGADELGQRTGSYQSGDYSGSLGWGMEVLPSLSGGVVLKGNRSSFGNKNFQTYSTDVGVLWNAVPSLDLGVSYSNLQFGGGVAGATLASGWRLGAGWNANKHWLLAASGEIQEKSLARAQFGTEVLIGDVEKQSNLLALRGGYQLSFPNRELGAMAGMSLGLGYTLTRSIVIDYAFLPAGDLGNSQRLSVTFKFNSLRNKRG